MNTRNKRPGPQRRWTEEDARIIYELYEVMDKPAKLIAPLFGLSPSTIAQIARKYREQLEAA